MATVKNTAGVRVDTDLVNTFIDTTPVQPESTLEPNDVALEDGRIVTMRKTNALDDTRIDALIYDTFKSSNGTVSPSVSLRCQAVNAVYAIDGKPLMPITNKKSLEDRLFQFGTDDMDTIADKYLDVIGKKKALDQAMKEMQEGAEYGTSF